MESIVRTENTARPLFDGPLVKRAIIDSFIKLSPRVQIRNPVMFTTGVVAVLSTVIYARDIAIGLPLLLQGIMFTTPVL